MCCNNFSKDDQDKSLEPAFFDKGLNRGKRFFDPHVHMTSRTTDDYQAMADAGIVGLIEPAFWLGQPRTGIDTFRDYYNSLIGWERFRSSQFGIKHYCTIGLNSREANNEALAQQVMEILPLFIYKEGVVGVGEIGFDDQTAAEDKYYRLQLELAKEAGLPVQVHTPHRDKKKGTQRSMAIALEHGLDPAMVIIDHNNEETVKEVLDGGFYAAFTIYPFTKMGNERMVEIVKQYGAERIMVNSAADWGISDPLAVPKTAALMKINGITDEAIELVTYRNAITAKRAAG
jgi:predicted metal-dependent TIM-barrel fold hydrolase